MGDDIRPGALRSDQVYQACRQLVRELAGEVGRPDTVATIEGSPNSSAENGKPTALAIALGYARTDSAGALEVTPAGRAFARASGRPILACLRLFRVYRVAAEPNWSVLHYNLRHGFDLTTPNPVWEVSIGSPRYDGSPMTISRLDTPDDQWSALAPIRSHLRDSLPADVERLLEAFRAGTPPWTSAPVTFSDGNDRASRALVLDGSALADGAKGRYFALVQHQGSLVSVNAHGPLADLELVRVSLDELLEIRGQQPVGPARGPAPVTG